MSIQEAKAIQYFCNDLNENVQQALLHFAYENNSFNKNCNDYVVPLDHIEAIRTYCQEQVSPDPKTLEDILHISIIKRADGYVCKIIDVFNDININVDYNEVIEHYKNNTLTAFIEEHDKCKGYKSLSVDVDHVMFDDSYTEYPRLDWYLETLLTNILRYKGEDIAITEQEKVKFFEALEKVEATSINL